MPQTAKKEKTTILLMEVLRRVKGNTGLFGQFLGVLKKCDILKMVKELETVLSKLHIDERKLSIGV